MAIVDGANTICIFSIVKYTGENTYSIVCSTVHTKSLAVASVMAIFQQPYRFDLQVAVLKVAHLLQLLSGVHALGLAGQNIPGKCTLLTCP